MTEKKRERIEAIVDQVDKLEEELKRLRQEVAKEEAVSVDWKTLKTMILDWSNWAPYQNDTYMSSRERQWLCIAGTDGDECCSGVCDVDPFLFEFRTASGELEDMDLFVMCEICADNGGLKARFTDEQFDSLADGNEWHNETFLVPTGEK